ncbi:hypothetical protein Fmac_024482 [Flemingia macrophylla]|uniref:Glabrous enhancer-binding protein-like DBD domain-containing protein n=1 Tax=Flemingia macrophylla TaxID=520843 RepID=A0ABD1LPH4_9FABA
MRKNKLCFLLTHNAFLLRFLDLVASLFLSSSSEQEQNLTHDDHNDINHQRFIIQDDHEDDHFLPSCDLHTIPVARAVPNASPTVTVAFPAADDDTNTIPTTATTIVTRSKGQRTANYSGMVRQYHRLWTKQDEMELLKGYLDYLKHHGKATTSLQNDVASLYDHVRPKLNVDFNRHQLVEKMRRLKRKHKLALDKGRDKEVVPFRNPQDQAIFEISHKIWGDDADNIMDHDGLDGYEPGRTPDHVSSDNIKVKVEQVNNSDEMDNRVAKRPRLDVDDVDTTNEQNHGDTATAIQGFIEETMRSCFPPLLKEVMDEAHEEPHPELVPIPMLSCSGEVDHEQWRKRRILELEVYLKRLELLQDKIKAKLEELRTS